MPRRASATPGAPARSARYGDEEDAGSDQIIPDRVLPLKLPPPWSHLRIWAWLDYPEEVAKLFSPKDADETDEDAGERIMEGMRTVITRHDGWATATACCRSRAAGSSGRGSRRRWRGPSPTASSR
jgi:hypothetical protein